jgi:IclR family acetate operon transcriptional repressor
MLSDNNGAERSRHDVQSVRRAFDILAAFSQEYPQLSVAEIAQRVNLNRTTVHRLVATLEAAGIVRRNPATQKYTLSARVLQLADVFMQQSDLRSVALPAMTDLRDRVNETVALHVREGNCRIVVAQVGANRDVRHMYRNVGQPIALHLGAPGKVMLAYASSQDISAYLVQGPLEERTPHSVTDPETLIKELGEIAAQGYAVSWEERTLGVVSLAAPVFDVTGAAVASVNVSGPSQRIREDEIREFIPTVMETGREISTGIGFAGKRYMRPL